MNKQMAGWINMYMYNIMDREMTGWMNIWIDTQCTVALKIEFPYVNVVCMYYITYHSTHTLHTNLRKMADFCVQMLALLLSCDIRRIIFVSMATLEGLLSNKVS